MLIFDESKMKKAKVIYGFALEDEQFCVAQTDSYDTLEITEGDEAWVLDLKTSNSEYLFVYFPEFGHATYVSSGFIEIE